MQAKNHSKMQAKNLLELYFNFGVSVEICHTSVLLNECLQLLPSEKNFSLLCDSTTGEGGHSFAFLSQFPNLRVLALDADEAILEKAKFRLSQFQNRVSFFNSWSDDFYKNYPSEFPKPDAILFDLGISMFHYVESKRGFSFQTNERLDMRLNKNEKKTAFDIVNKTSERDLANLIFQFSEEKFSRQISRAICENRKLHAIESAKDLSEIIFHAVPKNYRFGKIHPATKTFQALRIAVNSELERLPLALFSAFQILRSGGRLAVITFHSLEDRIVKTFFKNVSRTCVCPKTQAVCNCGGVPRAKLLTKKSISPSEDEIKINAASRSARLRVIEKLCDANENASLYFVT